jgi:hypothetical protein
MTCYVVTDQTAKVVSIGTVLASPLPAGLTANVISNADYDAILQGLKRWRNGAVEDTGLAATQANQATVAAALAQALSDLDAVIAAAAVPATVTSVAQAQTAVRAIQVHVGNMALHLKRAIRYATGDFTGTA